MKKLLIGLSASLALFFSGCGGGGGIDIGTLWVPTDVLVADINGDGRTDILTLAMKSTGYGTEKGYLLVYLQTDVSGIFAKPVAYEVGRYPWRMVLSDIDGDTAPDLVISDTISGVWLMPQDNLNRGKFLTPESLISGTSYYEAVIADFNADGVPDIAAANGALVIRYQYPTVRGSFEPQVTVSLSGRIYNLTAGDVDGDNLADILAWVYTNPSGVYPPTAGLVVMYQNPGGGFDISDTLAQQTGFNVRQLAITDFNADGRPDLFAFLTPFSSDYTAQLAVVPQNESRRSFGAPIYTSLAGVKGIDSAAVSDLNQDGLPDTTIAGFWPESGSNGATSVKSAVYLLNNTGQGAFSMFNAFPMPLTVSRVGVNDLNGDGRNDIVVMGDTSLVMMQTDSGTFSEPTALEQSSVQ